MSGTMPSKLDALLRLPLAIIEHRSKSGIGLEGTIGPPLPYVWQIDFPGNRSPMRTPQPYLNVVMCRFQRVIRCLSIVLLLLATLCSGDQSAAETRARSILAPIQADAKAPFQSQIFAVLLSVVENNSSGYV